MALGTPTSGRTMRSRAARAGGLEMVESAPTLLWSGLVDDAAVFPPGQAPLERALREHADHRAAWYAPVIGPLLVPAASARQLRTLLDATPRESPLRVGLIATGPEDLTAGYGALTGEPRVEVVHVEAPLDGGGRAAVRARVEQLLACTPILDVVVEAPWAQVQEVLGEVAARAPQLRVKLRTGGRTAEAFPAEDTLASALRRAVDLDLSIKLTAGLHRALRHTDAATGSEQHGFLNVVVAVRRALLGAEVAEMAGVLSERSPAPLLEQVTRMSDADATVVRSFFTAFGCCGVTDPVRDLVSLGLHGPTRTPGPAR